MKKFSHNQALDYNLYNQGELYDKKIPFPPLWA